jgi:hypothetical protein
MNIGSQLLGLKASIFNCGSFQNFIGLEQENIKPGNKQKPWKE